MRIKNYKDLIVWQKSRLLVKEIYKITKNFPEDEKFGLTSQVRRAAISIVSNIAEGHSRNSTKDYIRFVSMAIGSISEVEAQLIVASDLKFIEYKSNEHIFALINEIQKMLHSLRNSLKPKAQTLEPVE